MSQKSAKPSVELCHTEGFLFGTDFVIVGGPNTPYDKPFTFQISTLYLIFSAIFVTILSVTGS